MPERVLRSNRDQDIRSQRALSWKKSGIRVAVGDCSVTERRRWAPPYQTGKTVHVHAKQNRSTAPEVRGHDSIPLSHSGNVITRNRIYLPKALPFTFQRSIEHTGYSETTNATDNNKCSWTQQEGIGCKYLSGNNMPRIKLIRGKFLRDRYLLPMTACWFQ